MPTERRVVASRRDRRRDRGMYARRVVLFVSVLSSIALTPSSSSLARTRTGRRRRQRLRERGQILLVRGRPVRGRWVGDVERQAELPSLCVSRDAMRCDV